MSATAAPYTELDELAASIKANCALLARAETSALDHAIAAGHDLAKAKALVPGSWLDWVAVNLDISKDSAARYMRLARREPEIRAAGATSMTHAELIIVAAGGSLHGSAGVPNGRAKRLDGGVLDLVRSGAMTRAAAAELLSVSPSTISYHLKGGERPDLVAMRRRQRRDQAARAALRKQEEARIVRKAGGGHAELYSLIRRAVQLADNLIGEVANKEAKAHFATCTRRLHAAEDECVRASKLS